MGLASAPFDTAVDAVNAWISGESIEVLSVETLLSKASTPIQPSTVEAQAGLRVWYVQKA